MPTVLLIDCSLGMAERFSFVVKQGDNMETTMSIEKRSLIAKIIESLMASISNSPTKLETVAVVLFAGKDTIKIVQHFTKHSEDINKAIQKLPIFGEYALKPAIEFAKKFLTTTFGAQRSQKILVFTDSSHRDDDNDDSSDQMDVDLRKQMSSDEQAKSSSSNSYTDVSFVCIRKPANSDRARLEDVTAQTHCSFSKIYWLLNREKENNSTVTQDMIREVITNIKVDLADVFISVLKCGHYESQLVVYPTIKPAILQTTGELLQPSNTLTVNGFIELSSIRSAMATSKHILLPIQRYIKPQPAMPMFATKKSAVASATTTGPPTSPSLSSQKKSNAANNFYYLLLISLKKEKSAALISVNDQWFGAIHCQKFEKKKKSSRLILSVFEPGDHIPWIPSFERLGPYALVFPPDNNGDLAYKKQPWPVKPFARSYTDTFLIWCRQNNFQNDLSKFVRASAKLPEKVNIFHRELNKICRGAFIYGLRDRLFHLLQQLFQRQIQTHKIKPEAIKHVQNVINYMNRLSASDRYIKYEEMSSLNQ